MANRQSGAALITGLVFLVVLTMLGITSARMSSLEERMAGNTRDRALAMNAAEMALRDAERDLGNAVSGSSRDVSGLSGFTTDCGASTVSTSDNGLCWSGVGGYASPVWLNQSMTVAPSVAYGDYTGASDIPLVSAQPRYLVEGFQKNEAGGGQAFYYRITVRAQGANENTVIWLQEVYRP